MNADERGWGGRGSRRADPIGNRQSQIGNAFGLTQRQRREAAIEHPQSRTQHPESPPQIAQIPQMGGRGSCRATPHALAIGHSVLSIGYWGWRAMLGAAGMPGTNGGCAWHEWREVKAWRPGTSFVALIGQAPTGATGFSRRLQPTDPGRPGDQPRKGRQNQDLGARPPFPLPSLRDYLRPRSRSGG